MIPWTHFFFNIWISRKVIQPIWWEGFRLDAVFFQLRLGLMIMEWVLALKLLTFYFCTYNNTFGRCLMVFEIGKKIDLLFQHYKFPLRVKIRLTLQLVVGFTCYCFCQELPWKRTLLEQTNYMIQEAMENFVFPDKCSFMLIAMTKALLTNNFTKPLRMLGWQPLSSKCSKVTLHGQTLRHTKFSIFETTFLAPKRLLWKV